jgi:hypothetical protein
MPLTCALLGDGGEREGVGEGERDFEARGCEVHGPGDGHGLGDVHGLN